MIIVATDPPHTFHSDTFRIVAIAVAYNVYMSRFGKASSNRDEPEWTKKENNIKLISNRSRRIGICSVSNFIYFSCFVLRTKSSIKLEI